MAQTNAQATTEKSVAQYWWLWLLEGFAIILIGWWLLAKPSVTTLALVQILGLYWFIAGIVDIVMALVDRDEEHRGLKLFGGIIGIIAGWWVMNNALFAGVLTPTIFLWIMAFSFIINGIIKVFVGNAQLTGGYKRSWGAFFMGLFYGLMGLMLLAMPLIAGLATLVLTAGLLALIGGIVTVVMAFQIKGMK
jgi:uncharacterized membrane protein HdeD (DUF308 family)